MFVLNMNFALGCTRVEGVNVQSLYDLEAKSLAGKSLSLNQFKGKVALVVNTASECGYTPQYAGLEKLYQELNGKGFTVLGFPSNDFGKQEPGDSQAIQTFCSTKFDVKFPLFEKVETKGAAQHPVYQFLTAQHGEPKWNFHKYLVGKDGRVIAAFPSKVAPEEAALRSAIDQALTATPTPN